MHWTESCDESASRRSTSFSLINLRVGVKRENGSFLLLCNIYVSECYMSEEGVKQILRVMIRKIVTKEKRISS